MGLAVETKGLTRLFGGIAAVDPLEVQVSAAPSMASWVPTEPGNPPRSSAHRSAGRVRG